MDTKNINEYYNWTEPTLIVQKTPENKTSYLLYNKILNFVHNDFSYKMVHIDVMNDDSDFCSYKKGYRTNYLTYIKNLYLDVQLMDSGFSAILDAIGTYKENLILLFKEFVLEGALSYDINPKKKTIIISHIGVINKRSGHGSILMKELFSIAKILNYKVEVTSNGFADPFYESFEMERIVDKPLGIYSISPQIYMKDHNKPHIAIRKR